MLKIIQLFVTKMFEADQAVTRSVHTPEQLVQLEVDRLGIAVLGILDKKYHQESDNGSGRIYDELPRIRIMKKGPGKNPCQNEERGQNKSPGRAHSQGAPVCAESESPVQGPAVGVVVLARTGHVGTIFVHVVFIAPGCGSGKGVNAS